MAAAPRADQHGNHGHRTQRPFPAAARPRLGALLPLVMLVCTVYWGVRPWTVLAIAVAAAVALLAPSVAAGLAAIALIGFASYAFGLFLRTSTLPPGSPTAANYPLHAWSSAPACGTPLTWRPGWSCWPAGCGWCRAPSAGAPRWPGGTGS